MKLSQKATTSANHKHRIIPIFIPELACPNRCVFCHQQKISGQIKTPSIGEVQAIIESHLATIPPRYTKEIAFFGGNFTGIPKQEQENYLKIAQPYIENGLVSSIRISTRPDYIDAPQLDVLAHFHVKTIELGAQSMHNDILALAQRGHQVEDIEQAALLIKEKGFNLGLQQMIGLPGDTKEKTIATTKAIIALKPDSTRIYPALVIAGTQLADWYTQHIFTPLTLEEAIDWTKTILPLYEQQGIYVNRVGLHPSEELSSQKSLLAGPFHPNFKEMVLTEIWYTHILNTLSIPAQGKLHLIVPTQEINHAIGFQAKNKKRLHDMGWQVTFSSSDNLEKRMFNVYYS